MLGTLNLTSIKVRFLPLLIGFNSKVILLTQIKVMFFSKNIKSAIIIKLLKNLRSINSELMVKKVIFFEKFRLSMGLTLQISPQII